MQAAAVAERLLLLTEKKGELDVTVRELERLEKDQAVRSELCSWLTDRFQPFTHVVERHVLGAVHGLFDHAVRDWFSQLVDDDSLGVTIDSSFSPCVRQQGYDVGLDALSGGERTALALAYRLSLVHAIHTLLPELATSGLLILDEPTDGFSSEQLGRVRDVLSRLDTEQVLIVSHEAQLEGFVDHILRVEKRPSGSTVSGAEGFPVTKPL